MYISQYLYLNALQQYANFKNYYIQIKSQGHDIWETLPSSTHLRDMWILGSYLKLSHSNFWVKTICTVATVKFAMKFIL